MEPLQNPRVDTTSLAGNVANYQGVDSDAANGVANVINVVANRALANAPDTVKTCASIGGVIGAFGGPVAWITVPMGVGTGAVIGCIVSAINGDFEHRRH